MGQVRLDAGAAGQEFERLVAIMDRLRSPGGCPWDAQQTHRSLVRYLIEESYEVVEAIEAADGVDRELLKEELGDVLLQVVFHARVAAEVPAAEGGFTVLDVLRRLNDKLESRHPHVFSDGAEAADADARWEELKKREKPERTSVFDGIPPQLPALAYAEKVSQKADRGGVGQPDSLPDAGEGIDSEEELGAVLYSLVVSARRRGLDPERALRAYTRGIVRGR